RRQSPYPTLTHDEININTNNPDVKNPEQNIGCTSSTETSSLQPPPYEATNEAQNQSQDDFNNLSSNLSNLLLLRNESDVSMHDVV
ncbi:2172_t:CDS:1, partial [Diversispora eburnea]